MQLRKARGKIFTRRRSAKFFPVLGKNFRTEKIMKNLPHTYVVERVLARSSGENGRWQQSRPTEDTIPCFLSTRGFFWQECVDEPTDQRFEISGARCAILPTSFEVLHVLVLN